MRGRGDQSRMHYDEAPNASVYADSRGQPAASVQPMDLASPELGGMAQVKPAGQSRNKVPKPGNGGDALVFIAMGLVSVALGLGLYAHIGIDLPVALIAAAGLFVSTSFLHVFVRRMQGVDLLDHRVTALEETVSRIDAPEMAGALAGGQPHMVQSEHQVAVEELRTASGFERLDRVENLEDGPLLPAGREHSEVPVDARTGASPETEALDLPPAYQIPRDAVAGFGGEGDTTGRSLAEPIYDLARSKAFEAKATTGFDAPRPEFGLTDAGASSRAFETGNPNLEAPNTTRSIDGLVKQLSEGMSGASETPAALAPVSNPATGPARAEAETTATQAPAGAATFGQREFPPSSRREAGETPLIAMSQKNVTEDFDPILGASPSSQEANVDPVGQAILDAAKRGSVDIYLQPILSIEDRKVRFFEVLGRVQGLGGEVIAAEDHVELTRFVGASSGLDRAVLTRAARLLRKLSERRQAQPLFCNISRETLSDSNFPRDFADLIGGFRDIAAFLIFEIDHAVVAAADNTTLSNLRALGSMGFRLSIDKVTNVEQALANGRELDVSFIKLAYDVFMPMQQNQADARARAATIQSVARDSGMTLIVDQIERKDQLAGTVTAGVNLGQGYLFSEPKPLLPQVAAEVAEDSAVA